MVPTKATLIPQNVLDGNVMTERRTENSKLGQRGYKGPKWLAQMFSPSHKRDDEE